MKGKLVLVWMALSAKLVLSQPTSVDQIPDATGAHFDSLQSLIERYGFTTLLRGNRLEADQPLTTQEMQTQLEEARQLLLRLRSSQHLGPLYLKHLNRVIVADHPAQALQLQLNYPASPVSAHSRGQWIDWLDSALGQNVAELAERSRYENLATDFARELGPLNSQQSLARLEHLETWHSGDEVFRARLKRQPEIVQLHMGILLALNRKNEAIQAVLWGYEANLQLVVKSLESGSRRREADEAYRQALEILQKCSYTLGSLGQKAPAWKTEPLEKYQSKYHL